MARSMPSHRDGADALALLGAELATGGSPGAPPARGEVDHLTERERDVVYAHTNDLPLGPLLID